MHIIRNYGSSLFLLCLLSMVWLISSVNLHSRENTLFMLLFGENVIVWKNISSKVLCFMCMTLYCYSVEERTERGTEEFPLTPWNTEETRCVEFSNTIKQNIRYLRIYWLHWLINQMEMRCHLKSTPIFSVFVGLISPSKKKKKKSWDRKKTEKKKAFLPQQYKKEWLFPASKQASEILY